jgi:hypothetical protein
MREALLLLILLLVGCDGAGHYQLIRGQDESSGAMYLLDTRSGRVWKKKDGDKAFKQVWILGEGEGTAVIPLGSEELVPGALTELWERGELSYRLKPGNN